MKYLRQCLSLTLTKERSLLALRDASVRYTNLSLASALFQCLSLTLTKERSLLAAVLLTLSTAHATASPFDSDIEIDRNAPVTINADAMHYDREAGTVSATGNVEVIQGERILLASLITYHQPSQRVYAKGSVNVLEPDGNHYTAEEVELTDDLKQGVIEGFHARLSDNSTFTAERAERIDDSITELEHARYTPCFICRDDETGQLKPPLWQLRANEVVINETEKRVKYEHPRLEVYGVPVVYSPYFSHPTPDAERQSGILRPTYRLDSQLGTMVEVPYYWNIAPQMDATITPLVTTKEGVLMQGEFRHLTPSGSYSITASGTYPERRNDAGNIIDGHEFRGHIEAEGAFRLDPNWTWGFDAKRSTDDTYLRRYNFSHEDMLVSRLYLDGLGDARSQYDRSFFSTEAISFQGLRVEDDPDTTPLIAPRIRFAHETAHRYAGGAFGITGDAMSLTRSEGSHSHRLSVTSYWTRNGVVGYGQLWDVSLSLRGDSYLVTDLPPGFGTDDNETSFRLIPEAALRWRYPWQRRFEHASAIIEPVVELYASPNRGAEDEIPNEDSQVQDFDATSLLMDNRYTGRDRYEHGLRANVALRTSITLDDGPSFSALIGQHIRHRPEYSFTTSSDPLSHRSDYVAMVTMESDALWLLYRARMDESSFESRRQEVSANINFHPIIFNMDYFLLDNDPILSDREEAFASASYTLNDHWTLMAGGRRDLGQSNWIDARAGLTYSNECLTIISSLRRQFTSDRDVKPSTALTFQLSLKNLN